jgi:hypothetical protein
MPPWLILWIARIASGERLQKADSSDYRLWFGALFLFPVVVGLLAKFGTPLFKSSAVLVWLILTFIVIGYIVLIKVWGKFVPALVSLVLAVIAWSVGFWLAWH